MIRLKRRTTIVVGCLVVGLMLVGGIFLLLTSKNVGQVQQRAAQQTTEQTIVSTKNLDGKYIGFSYPSYFIAQQLEAKDGDLEVYQFGGDSPRHLAASVTRLPNSSLENSSAYTFRKGRTDLYSERKLTVNGQTADIWVARDGSEQTVFLTNKGVVAILAFTETGTSQSKLTALVDDVVNSFSWKK